jgi:ubiquitin carboxyl-terminal hydrolase 4/11/15
MSSVQQGICVPFLSVISPVLIPLSQVSITFDPFMYLTLPLPVNKKWRHEIYYIPADTSKMHVKVPVELNRDSTFRDLRNLLGRWMGANPDNVHNKPTFLYCR